MTYIKRQPDFLFTGYELFEGDRVLVTDETGKVLDIIHAEDAGEEILKVEGLLSPGFVNAHCHLELSHMRNMVSRGLGMTGFIREIVTRRFADEQIIKDAIREAEEEMIGNGIVAVGDICNTSHTISQKSESNLYYHSFIEEFGLDEKVAGKRYDAAQSLKKRFEEAGAGAVSIVPHAPYSVSPHLFNLIAESSSRQILTIHNQESQEEDEFIEFGSGPFHDFFLAAGMAPDNITPKGKRSLPYVLPWLKNARSVLLVHNVFTEESDLQELELEGKERFYWCLCPNANLYITGRLPDVPLLMKYTDKFVLGTDSLASNRTLSIRDEIKVIRKHFPGIELKELMKWATINGAKALGIDRLYGSFEKGKRPGMVIMETDELRMMDLKN